MDISILEHQGPLAEAILARHETQWGFRLPSEYRGFLLQYNGGYPQPDAFVFQGSTKGSLVDRFLGIHSGEYDNLLAYLENYFGRVPQNLFPIAHDPGGNLICISVQGEDWGKIYFWDHEEEVGDEDVPDYSNITLIADDFGQFLGSLHKLEY